MASLADRLGISGEHELTIGSSFQSDDKQSAYHSIRYDFKPASVDGGKPGTLELSDGRAVSVSLPHVDGVSRTRYRGSCRPHQKECVLVVDHDTGQVTLERLAESIQVKKTRNEVMSTAARLGIPSPRPMTPIETPPRRNSPLTIDGGPVRAGKVSGGRTTKASSNSGVGGCKAGVSPPPPPVIAGSMPVLGGQEKWCDSDGRAARRHKMAPPCKSSAVARLTASSSDDDANFDDECDEQAVDDVRPLVSTGRRVVDGVRQMDGGRDNIGVAEMSDSSPSSDSSSAASSSDNDDDEGGRRGGGAASRHTQPLSPPPPSRRVTAANKRSGSTRTNCAQPVLPSMPSANLFTDLQLSDSD